MLKIYAIKDIVADRIVTIFTSATDGEAVRNNMPNAWQILPKKDVELLRIGEFNEKNYIVSPTPIETVNLNSYMFPEIEAKNESTTQNEDIKKMQEQIAEIQKNINKEAANEARNMEVK